MPLRRDLDRPSVLIGFPAEPAGLTCVDLDFYQAGITGGPDDRKCDLCGEKILTPPKLSNEDIGPPDDRFDHPTITWS